MKKLTITILAFIVLLTSIANVQAIYYTDFRNAKVVCTETSMELQATHTGRVIDVADITITAEDEQGITFNVEGGWYIGENKVTYIKGPEPDTYTNTAFKATTKFPKNENYKVYFSYKRSGSSSGSGVYQLVANCPGQYCSSDIHCADSETCEEGRCTKLECNVCQKPFLNSCIPKCADNNICTKDICIEGICTYEEVNNCCETANDCNDGLQCTQDLCINERCTNPAVECVGTELCVYGACKEGQGCVYDTNLTCLNEENRRYVLQLGTPKVVEKDTARTNLFSTIMTLIKNFFG